MSDLNDAKVEQLSQLFSQIVASFDDSQQNAIMPIINQLLGVLVDLMSKIVENQNQDDDVPEPPAVEPPPIQDKEDVARFVEDVARFVRLTDGGSPLNTSPDEVVMSYIDLYRGEGEVEVVGDALPIELAVQTETIQTTDVPASIINTFHHIELPVAGKENLDNANSDTSGAYILRKEQFADGGFAFITKTLDHKTGTYDSSTEVKTPELTIWNSKDMATNIAGYFARETQLSYNGEIMNGTYIVVGDTTVFVEASEGQTTAQLQQQIVKASNIEILDYENRGDLDLSNSDNITIGSIEDDVVIQPAPDNGTSSQSNIIPVDKLSSQSTSFDFDSDDLQADFLLLQDSISGFVDVDGDDVIASEKQADGAITLAVANPSTFGE